MSVAPIEEPAGPAIDGTAESPPDDVPPETPPSATGRPGWVVAVAAAVIVGLVILALSFGHGDTLPYAEGGGDKSSLLYVDDSSYELALIRPQAFRMGDDASHADERPAHDVELTEPFYVGVREVTNAMFGEYLRASGARYRPARAFADEARDDWPVVNVSWRDARAYIRWYSRRAGAAYRLPTEAEWEFLALQARDVLDETCAYANALGGRYDASLAPSTNLMRGQDLAGSGGCVDEAPVLVGVDALGADGLGLRHLYGNAAEWVADCYAVDYSAAPADGSAFDPEGCRQRVYRGGSWLSRVEWLSPTLRARAPPDFRDFQLGFRMIREPGTVGSWIIENPEWDWDNGLRIFRWSCYGAAAAIFLVMSAWFLRYRWRRRPTGAGRGPQGEAPEAAGTEQLHRHSAAHRSGEDSGAQSSQVEQ